MEKTNKQKIAILSLSGGMDSTSLLLYLLEKNYDVRCLSFNYGQRHKIELERGTELISYLKTQGFNIERTIIDLSILGTLFNSGLIGKDAKPIIGHYSLESQRGTVVPNRNAIFASITYGYALSLAKEYNIEAAIALGTHQGDYKIDSTTGIASGQYPDCSEEFRVALEYAFKIGNWDSEKVSYYAPYNTTDKTGVLKDGIENCKKLGLDWKEIYKRTNTSYAPTEEGKAHGYTGADVERIISFHTLGLVDPVEYVDGWETVLKYALEEEAKFSLF
jgi:7-cyano-7-deazaguanine synthase